MSAVDGASAATRPWAVGRNAAQNCRTKWKNRLAMHVGGEIWAIDLRSRRSLGALLVRGAVEDSWMATEWPLIVGPGRTDSFFPRTPFSSTVNSLYKPNHAVASPRQNRPRLERWTVDRRMIKPCGWRRCCLSVCAVLPYHDALESLLDRWMQCDDRWCCVNNETWNRRSFFREGSAGLGSGAQIEGFLYDGAVPSRGRTRFLGKV